jgi:hypothetical protein
MLHVALMLNFFFFFFFFNQNSQMSAVEVRSLARSAPDVRQQVKRSKKLSLHSSVGQVPSSLSPLWSMADSELSRKRALVCNVSHSNSNEQFLEFRIQFWDDSEARVFKSVATVLRTGATTVRTTESRRPSRVGGQFAIPITLEASWEDMQEMFERAVMSAAATIADQRLDSAANAFMATIDADVKEFFPSD